MAKNGVNAFKIDQHWMDPDRGQPRANRRHGRNEPLQFPDKVPPRDKTHAHGCWISHQGSQQMSWVDYYGDDEDDCINLPHNVSLSKAHWINCSLPDGTAMRTLEDVA